MITGLGIVVVSLIKIFTGHLDPGNLHNPELTQWNVVREKDQLTDVFSVYAYNELNLEGGGKIQTIARCHPKGIRLEFLFFSEKGQPNSFDWQQSGALAVSWRVMNISYRFDEGLVKSYEVDEEHPNQVVFDIGAPASETSNDITRILGETVRRNYGSDIPDLAAFKRAVLIRISLPLADGRKPVVKIEPKSSDFLAFENQCPALARIP